ncbi:uncharacterized protein ASPGLDRAFT_1176992 [Aspergillus glaucus CBS 516.65]|uniref:Zn(2)-C6 fungal-type domain-containing protein n=1 Tax=Aspergillus glaucus CBS 516.65 TaxID=1160497 RepID=A0A1L9VU61_ASPGL|nr:hypothetical protein ASPGLDRAFT_1176992 [Aspergillus glaucus CBS 516.65]OJJ87445.1 hypothetical protein ASPGLDRAFT_1176992 [Aspergillus glaucus CBS 516.65]
MSTDLTLSLRCPVCSRAFGRQAHLERHALTHSTDYPFSCPFCDSKYKRSDALRRHWKTCNARLALGSQIPERTLSGKRKQACDRCADRKRACSQGQPCTGCLQYEAECTYQRVKKPRITRDSNSSIGPIRQDRFDASKETSKAVHRFDFLRNFTHASGINQAYNYKRCLVSEPELPPEQTCVSNPWGFLFDDIEAILADDQLNTDLAFPDCLFAEDPVHLKAREIWDTFRPFIERNPTPTVLMTDIVEFFSPENLVSSLDLFWDRWYPHCPIIHQPTFEISHCPVLLLSTMVLIGACTSPSLSYRNETTGTSIDEQSDGQKVSVLQATYFMCIMQKWDGNDAAKLRIQRNRFTAFVAATRAMGLARATHRNFSITSDFGTDQWHRYIENEGMIS